MTEAIKLVRDPRQAHLKTIQAGLEALFQRLGLNHHGLLLSMRGSTDNNQGHPRRDPADDGNARQHHHGAHQTTGKRDRHVVPIARGRDSGQRPPQTITPRTPGMARNIPLGALWRARSRW